METAKMNDLMNDPQNELLPYNEQDIYMREIENWLPTEAARPNTRRAYITIMQDFVSYVFRHMPSEYGRPDNLGQVTDLHVRKWIEDMQTRTIRTRKGGTRKMSKATIAQRVAGVSSFYRHLVHKRLIAQNPADIDRRDLKVTAFAHAKKITMIEYLAILAEFDAATPSGAMYRAIFQALAWGAKRREEMLGLKGSDIRKGRIAAGIQYYEYFTNEKGGKERWNEFSPIVWDAIQHYLAVSGRTINGDEYLFRATRATGFASGIDDNQPLSGQTLMTALKRAADRAGVGADRVSPHSLRHLGALMHYRAHGRDVYKTSKYLGHSNIQVTGGYLEDIDKETVNWSAMAAELENAMNT